MRNDSKSAMLRMRSLLESMNGHLLRESESREKFSQWRLDALSIPHFVIKKGRPRGARHGKPEAQKAFCGSQRAEEVYQKEF